MLRLAIIIINYRTPHFMKGCLKSLNGQINTQYDKVIIVDNDSGDGSADIIETFIQKKGWNKWIQVERSPVNGGFSAGNNFGIRLKKATNYILLNSDTIVRPGTIKELLHAASINNNAGLISPRLEWPDSIPQESCFRHRNPFYEFFSAARTGIIDQLLGHRAGTIPVSDEPISSEWTSFACILIRREVFKRIGFLDEGYFMYFEDMDFCRRAWEAGIATLHWPMARVIHLRGGSSPVKKLTAERKRPPRYWYASRNRYYTKFYGRKGLCLANLCWYAGRMISLTREMFRLKKPHTNKFQWLDIWTNAFNPLRKYYYPK